MNSPTLAVVAILAVGQGVLTGRVQSFRLQDLTVPPDRLPGGCALEDRTPRPLPDGRVAVSSGAGLGLNANPWIGTDKPVLASIRERLESPTRLPDGPPLSRGEAARFRLHLADDIEEGYLATYEQPARNADGAIAATASELTLVYGLRFSTPDATAHMSRLLDSTGYASVTAGRIFVGVSGGGPCLPAIVAYLKSLKLVD